MKGSVRFYLPGAGRGLLQTETGERYPFSECGQDLHGGDLVEFDLRAGEAPAAVNIRLQHRWADLLNEKHRPLVNQMHKLLGERS